MLGICVVYLVTDPDGYHLLDHSIHQLVRTTRGPFKIYGCCPNGDAETLRKMAAHSVNIEPMGERRKAVNHEHSMLLDALVDRAVSEGCDDVVTFDMDSWPVRDGWDEAYGSLVSEKIPVVAMVRTEQTDNFPFAAFTYLRKGFWRVGQSSFSTELRTKFTPEATALSRRGGETGSGILAQLYTDRQSFYRMERSNQWDVHPMISGVYDNAVFHLGAGSREPQFDFDRRWYGLNGSALRRDFATRSNAAARAFSVEKVLSRHDEFIAELTGPGLPWIHPIETDPQTLPRELPATPVGQRRRG